MADHQDATAPHDAAETPTVETTLTEAAVVLREARIHAVAETAPRLISVADSWIAMAHLIDRRNRDVRE